MAIDEGILAVVEAFYDAALDETRWPAALRDLTDFTGSQAATLWVLDSSSEPRLPTLICLNFEPRFIAEYQDGMVPLDPTVQYLVAHPDQPIVHDGLVISEREKDRHPYYDWHAGHSDTRFRMVGQARPAPGVQAGVALHRRNKVGRYEPADLERFAVLHRHLERALAIGFRLGSLGAMQQCCAELLDLNPTAIVMLDERQRPVFANRAAQALQSNGDGLRLTGDGVTLPRRQDNDRLQALIGQALSAETGSVGGTMRAQRLSGKRPYGIAVCPVSRRNAGMADLRPAVCIVITDPDRQTPVAGQRLQAVFGLTPAEARLAELLAAGENLRFAADRLQITYGTARTRLGVIFQKTDTRRQGELVRLLLTALAAV